MDAMSSSSSLSGCLCRWFLEWALELIEHFQYREDDGKHHEAREAREGESVGENFD